MRTVLTILAGAAIAVVDALYKPGFRYVKAGVMLLDVEADGGCAQTSLWDAGDSIRSDALMRAIDGINTRMGRNTLRVASTAMYKCHDMHTNLQESDYGSFPSSAGYRG